MALYAGNNASLSMESKPHCGWYKRYYKTIQFDKNKIIFCEIIY